MTTHPDKFAWSPEFSVGVPALDAQHRKMIDTLNGLLAQPDADLRSAILLDTLTRLTQYAGEHFKDEERLMEAAGYPGIEQHKQKHMEFREKMVECCLAARLGVDSVPRQLVQFLVDWLNHHVLQEDLKYKPFLEHGKDS
jgi:hemerythrin